MVAIHTLAPDMMPLAEHIDRTPPEGNADGEVSPAELDAARPRLIADAAFRTPENRAAIRRLTELLIPWPVTPPEDSGVDLDDAVRPRTIGRNGEFESRLFPSEGRIRREVVTFCSPQNPKGLPLVANTPVTVPRQLVSGSVIAVNVKLRGAPAMVKAMMEGETVPPWPGSRTDGLKPYSRAISLVSDGPTTVEEMEVFYSPHVNLATPDESGDLGRLNETQRKVVEDVKAKAEQRSEAARERLVAKAANLGFTEREVDLMLDYVASIAPITVNFNPDKPLRAEVYGAPVSDYVVSVDRSLHVIDAFLVDDRYKNQFETGITSGSASAHTGGSRDIWEKTIFEGGYHGHPLVREERPKYGAMNPSWRPAGPAATYGACYLILKRGLRNRTTITHEDSSCCRAENVGMAKHCQHVLADLEDSHFSELMRVALGYDYPSEGGWSYMEAQIHGPLEFGKDIQRLVIHRRFRGTEYEDKLRQWAHANGFDISWHDGQEVHVDGEMP